MKKLRWGFWKSRSPAPASPKEVPAAASPKRRFHLGIDYGTSTSKLVFRDYGARGGEKAVLVLRNGSFRIPSRVCMTATEFLFGDGHKAAEYCDIYESVKMLVAADVCNDSRFYFGPPKEMPNAFSAADLATLTVWYLISEGYRAIDSYLNRNMEGVSIGMTMGVPMSFFRDAKLRGSFLCIARRAWLLYREEGLLASALLVEKARRILDQYPSERVPATLESEVRDWVRSEGEAAMWWAFQSPSVASGPYAEVDIGAGTTHASLYRIFGTPRTPKTGMAFFGAVSVPVGMDAVDSAIAESDGYTGDCLALRGRELSILKANGKARGALIPVRGRIYEAYRKAWIETYRKMSQSSAELRAWGEHKVFVIGGGSLIPFLVETVRVHPGRQTLLQQATLEQPSDLIRSDNHRVTLDELPFITVAYGLSNIGLSIPEAFTPDEVPPMTDGKDRRARLDHEDIYAK